jgi:hypothetical protein
VISRPPGSRRLTTHNCCREQSNRPQAAVRDAATTGAPVDMLSDVNAGAPVPLTRSTPLDSQMHRRLGSEHPACDCDADIRRAVSKQPSIFQAIWPPLSPVTDAWHVFRVSALHGLALQANVSQSKSALRRSFIDAGTPCAGSARIRQPPCTLPWRSSKPARSTVHERSRL